MRQARVLPLVTGDAEERLPHRRLDAAFRASEDRPSSDALAQAAVDKALAGDVLK